MELVRAPGWSARSRSLPRYDESPAAPAKIVSASPETIWFARSVITRNAWISAIAAPASAATTTAAASATGRRAVEPLHRPEAHHGADQHHPLDAEVEHARALGEQLAERGVEQRRPVGDGRARARRRGSSCSRRRLRRRRRRVPRRRTSRIAVADEQLAAERAEEDQPLHHADEPGREVGALQRVAGVLEPAEQERDEHDGERVVARERGDDDAGVAVAAAAAGRAGRAVWRKSPSWLAPPRPAIAPESAITARIFRRVRMPA